MKCTDSDDMPRYQGTTDKDRFCPWLPLTLPVMEELTLTLKNVLNLRFLPAIYDPSIRKDAEGSASYLDKVMFNVENFDQWFISEKVMPVIYEWSKRCKRPSRYLPLLLSGIIYLPMTSEESDWCQMRISTKMQIVFGPFD